VRLATTATIAIALLATACASPAAATWTFAPPAGAAGAGSPDAPVAAIAARPSPSVTPKDPVLGQAVGGGSGSTDGGTPPPAAPTAPTSAAVQIADYAFGPTTVTVAAGGRVTWTNRDGDRHSVLVGSDESPRLESGATHSLAFDAAGRFSYACGLHPSMTGTVVVVAAGAAAPAGAGSSTPGSDPVQQAPTGPPAGTAGPGATDDADDDRDDDDDDDRSGHGGGSDDDHDHDHSGHGGGGSGHG
jgi:plastocyanin